MTILLNFVGVFNSFVANGIEWAAWTGFDGDVIDGIVTVIGVVVAITAVVVDVVAAAFVAIIFNFSVHREIHL